MTHIVSTRTCLRVWIGLVALLAATFVASRWNLPHLNALIALTISIAKMILIILFFMNARHGRRTIWVFAGAGFLWLLIFIELVMSDYLTRGSSWTQ